MIVNEPGGRYYWGVETSLDAGGRIYLSADTTEVKDGCLVFSSEQLPGPGITFAPGQWRAFFLASGLDGHPVVVERWRPKEVHAKRAARVTVTDGHARARRLRDEGASFREVARELGISKTTAQRWCADQPAAQ